MHRHLSWDDTQPCLVFHATDNLGTHHCQLCGRTSIQHGPLNHRAERTCASNTCCRCRHRTDILPSRSTNFGTLNSLRLGHFRQANPGLQQPQPKFRFGFRTCIGLYKPSAIKTKHSEGKPASAWSNKSLSPSLKSLAAALTISSAATATHAARCIMAGSNCTSAPKPTPTRQ